MKAIVMTRFGPPEVLRLQEVAKPIPKDNEVLIKIHATSVFAGDCEIRGLKLPVALRLPIMLYLTFFGPKPLILGQELAGEIEAVGKDVTQFKAGDPVFATSSIGMGGYAEYKCMAAAPGMMGGALAIKPANLTYGEAATIPVGGLEALHFVRTLNIQRGETLLINGAGGSIGVMLIQLAKLRGAVVTAVDSAEKLETLRSIGAEHVIDYAQEDFTKSGQTYDVIIDVVGKSSFAGSLRALKENGRYFLGNPGLGQMLRARFASTGSKKIMQGSGAQRAEDLVYLRDLLEAGQLKPVVDRHYSLEQMADAHRYVDAGHKKGNIVVEVSQTGR